MNAEDEIVALKKKLAELTALVEEIRGELAGLKQGEAHQEQPLGANDGASDSDNQDSVTE